MAFKASSAVRKSDVTQTQNSSFSRPARKYGTSTSIRSFFVL
jgi:hypothetical protein